MTQPSAARAAAMARQERAGNAPPARRADPPPRVVRRPDPAECPEAWARVVRFDLADCMRQHRVAIRELAGRCGLTQKVIRARRRQAAFTLNDALAYYEAITRTGDFAGRA